MRFIELFAGIGGFRYGLERAGESHREPTEGERNQESGDGRESSGRRGLRPRGNSTGIERCRGARERSIDTNTFTNERWVQKQESKNQPNIESREGFYCVWANEWDKYACQVYRKHYGYIYEGDIRAVDPATIPEHDLIVAGFPCQSFSIAGKRGGFEDTRGTLFFEIMRIARAKGTPYLLLENVKGLLSHDEGRTYQTILRTLDELGYDCQWEVLNSKNFGVPQNRERVFIIGHLRGQPRPQVFPLGETGSDDGEMEYKGETFGEITSTLQARGQQDLNASMILVHNILDKRLNPKNKDIASSLCGGAHSGGNHSDMDLIQEPRIVASRGRNQDNPLDKWKGLTERRTAKSKEMRKESRKKGRDWSPRRGKEVVARDDDMLGAITATPTVENTLANSPTEQRLDPNSEGTTVQKDNWLAQNQSIRRLTPTECERLQGFPDGWTSDGLAKDGEQAAVSDTQRYKCLGNAVTTSVVEAIGWQIRASQMEI